MNDDSKVALAIFAAIIGMIIISVVAFSIGHSGGVEETQRAAVKAGVARYAADPETGAVRFEYLTPNR